MVRFILCMAVLFATCVLHGADGQQRIDAQDNVIPLTATPRGITVLTGAQTGAVVVGAQNGDDNEHDALSYQQMVDNVDTCAERRDACCCAVRTVLFGACLFLLYGCYGIKKLCCFCCK